MVTWQLRLCRQDICYSNILNVGNKDKYFNNSQCHCQFTSKQNWIALGGPTPTGLLVELFCSTSATPLVSVGHKKYQKHWYMLYHLQRLVSPADSSPIHAVYIPRQLVLREVPGFSKKIKNRILFNTIKIITIQKYMLFSLCHWLSDYSE